MNRQVILFFSFLILAFFFGCENNNDQQVRPPHLEKHYALPTVDEYNKERVALYPVEEFKVPDSVKTSFLIAAYDEDLPQPGRTVLIYTDSTLNNVTKISYLSGAIVKTESLIKVRPNEFRSRFSSETYLVTETHVYWGNTTGAASISYAYTRMDNYRFRDTAGM